MRRKVVALAMMVAAATRLTGCGTDADSPTTVGAVASLSATESAASVRIEPRFRYESATPRLVNGRPVLEHRYWSCIDRMTVEFPKPMRLTTVIGQVFVTNAYRARRAPTLTAVSPDFKRFTYEFKPQPVCDDHQQLRRLVVSREVRTVGGETSPADHEHVLTFPSPCDSLPESAAPAPSTAPLSAAHRASSSHQEAACSGSGCLGVTPGRLNAATLALRSWIETERRNPLYQGNGLKQLPLEHLLMPFTAVSRKRHYGSADLLYALRRAARFTQLLFPDLQKIPVADISLAGGETPHVDGTLLHPEGSHVEGRDVDVSYITGGSGNEPGAAWNPERNFWFIYGLLQSTGVDFIMTSHARELATFARTARSQGLITSLAVGRFHALMQDAGLNHDKHMHVAVHNGDNDGRSLRFDAADDVYACYLGLRPDTAVAAHNFCRSP